MILRRRAEKLSKMTGKIYKSRLEIENGTKNLYQEFKITLSRPWLLLFQEPIVLLLSIYGGILYGTLFMMFPGFPVVYQQERGVSNQQFSLFHRTYSFRTLVRFPTPLQRPRQPLPLCLSRVHRNHAKLYLSGLQELEV